MEPSFVCYKSEHTLLTDRVKDKLKLEDDLVVLNVSVEGTALASVDDAVRQKHRTTAVRLNFDPSVLGSEEFPERAAEVARQAFAVKRELSESEPSPFEGDWKVAVTCPADQCENVFDSDSINLPIPGDGAPVIVGRPPTITDVSLTEAAKEITPAKSLVRATDAAKYVVSSISIVSLVLGGLGIFGDLNSGFTQHPWAFSIVVLLAAVSLGCAVWALFPQTPTVNLDNLETVGRAYAGAIQHRAFFSKLATASLIAALFAALFAFFMPRAVTKPSAVITTNWDASGDNPILDVTVEVKDLPDGSDTKLQLLGLSELDDKSPTELSSAIGEGDAAGTAKVNQKIGVEPDDYALYKIVSSVTWEDGERSRVESSTFSPPPFTAAPPLSIEEPPASGTVVFRAFGGDAKQNGHYWTPVDPRAYGDYRAAAELPKENACLKLIVGRLLEPSRVEVGLKQRTSLIEYIVPKPSVQVRARSYAKIVPPC